MATEIEVKARVHDSEALYVLLHKNAEYSGAFDKEDTYWNFALPPAMPILQIRLRREKRIRADGTAVSATLATYKNKEVRDGIEINDEMEFEVNPGPEFERFLKTMGFKPGIFKRKRGWAFSRGEITAELVEVEKLGWFLELEILADIAEAGSLEKTVAEGKEKILGFLTVLGIGREAIESRYYSEMLAEP
ncbi:MAG: class IV adenylate cyclase [Treponema sp.]|nr:class IV adenylate cyclase [Treponema sp.]